MPRNKPSQRPPGKVPLERALSKLGFASRTQANALVKQGRVAVNGSVCRDPLRFVNPEKDQIVADGVAVKKAARVVLMVNKPKGLVTTRSDEKGRETIFSLVKDRSENLHAVGRLDMATTGLLLLTNDTRLSDWLTNPGNQVPRVYVATVRGEVTASDQEKLHQGIRDDGDLLRADEVVIIKASGKESIVSVRLHGGKNREIRRMFLALNHEVTKLKRIRFGGLELGDLKPGEVREVSEVELKKAFPGASGTIVA